MTVHELVQRIIEIAQTALEAEKHNVVYIGDTCDARMGLESILMLCQEVPKDQEAFKQYEKKEVSHAKSSEVKQTR
jgi:transcription initiation factor IIE alpha subunit